VRLFSACNSRKGLCFGATDTRLQLQKGLVTDPVVSYFHKITVLSSDADANVSPDWFHRTQFTPPEMANTVRHQVQQESSPPCE
jgi:hypothetical protein